MLDKPIDEIVYENGKVIGVRSQDEVRFLNNFLTPLGTCIYPQQNHHHTRVPSTQSENTGLYDSFHILLVLKSHFRFPSLVVAWPIYRMQSMCYSLLCWYTKHFALCDIV